VPSARWWCPLASLEFNVTKSRPEVTSMRESGRRVTAEYQRRGRFDWPGLNDASIFVHLIDLVYTTL
jgi:hypothetical protein